MKRIFYKTLALFLIIGLGSCKEEESLDVDLSQYNYDGFEAKEIDTYIYNNLTKPYNIEVVYRFDRSHSDPTRNISPPRIEKVQPGVDMILNGFIKVYENVAGLDFAKIYPPKQFVLFGSHAYNANGTVTLGTADGGRRVVLYDINNINPNDPSDIKRRLRTIHHEFTHIINQTVAIPPSFRSVTSDYVADWTAAVNTDAEALRLGFISQYSRSNFGEDFAETVAHLLIEGQANYDRRIATSSVDGANKLRLKQQIVEEYYKQYFNINFKELQYEIFLMLSNIYKDQSQTFFGYLNRAAVNTITVDLDNGSHYTIYGKPAPFAAVWENVRTVLPTITNNAGRLPVSFVLTFLSASKMQIQATYKNTAGTNFVGFYDFNIVYTADGNLDFTLVDDGTSSTQYNNGRVVIEGFRPLLNYFNNNLFKADWISPTIVGYSNSMKFAGFTVVGDDSNYIYGPVVLK